MPAEMHFATFVAALMETLEYGMEGAPPVCKQRVATLRVELEQVQKVVEVYRRRHFNTLAEDSVEVRQLLLSNLSIGLHEGMKALAVQGGELYRKYTYAAPAPGTGNSMATPTFKQLRALAEEGNESSLAERSAHWRPNTAGVRGVKRKGAPGTGGQREAPAQGRAGGRGGITPFKGRMHHSKTPAGMFGYLWRGLRFERPICSFAHDQGAGTAVQQQQPQPMPPPLPPPPPQQQQTQPAEAAGAGVTGGGGAGGSRPNVVCFSRNHVPAGRGGGGRGNGGNN